MSTKIRANVGNCMKNNLESSNRVDAITLPRTIYRVCKRGVYCYTIFGIFFGMLFPLSAWIFQFFFRNLTATLEHFYQIHNEVPLLYMIDTAPVFLGIFAYVAGRYKVSTEIYSNKLRILVADLEDMVSQRTLELEDTNKQLQQSCLQAAASSRAQRAFLANMSHEIRTPMNAIIGMATIAQQYVAVPEQRLKVENSIKQILISANHLLHLINNILDISKIEAGELHLVMEPFSITETLHECEQIILPRCTEKEINFILQQDAQTDIWVKSDKLCLMQVLINLIGNAIKFTANQGTVTLEVRELSRNERWVDLFFAIHDTGIGMTPETVAVIFQPFRQADDPVAHKSGGTGLGLAISENIVTTLGGKIEVASVLGKGSSFSFSLRMDLAAPVYEEHVDLLSGEALAGKRVLIIEDVAVNRLIVEELLAQTGIILDMAEDGAEGVRKFADSPVAYYDLILMDVQMPVLDGYEATRKIRMLDRADAAHIPIVAMTANAMKEDAALARQAGMNDHISKPLDVARLLAVLGHYLHS